MQILYPYLVSACQGRVTGQLWGTLWQLELPNFDIDVHKCTQYFKLPPEIEMLVLREIHWQMILSIFVNQTANQISVLISGSMVCSKFVLIDSILSVKVKVQV